MKSLLSARKFFFFSSVSPYV